eukprot:scaffold2785_cov291-Pinguiococcus_pyrenoidosus.AAC.6
MHEHRCEKKKPHRRQGFAVPVLCLAAPGGPGNRWNSCPPQRSPGDWRTPPRRTSCSKPFGRPQRVRITTSQDIQSGKASDTLPVGP